MEIGSVSSQKPFGGEHYLFTQGAPTVGSVYMGYREHYPLHWEYIPGLHMYMTRCRVCNSYLIGASGLHVYMSGTVYVGHGCSWTGLHKLQPLVCTVGSGYSTAKN